MNPQKVQVVPGQIIRTSDTDTGLARFRLSITKSSTIPLANQNVGSSIAAKMWRKKKTFFDQYKDVCEKLR